MPRKVDSVDRYRMKQLTDLYKAGATKGINVYAPKDSLVALKDPRGIVTPPSERKRPQRKKV